MPLLKMDQFGNVSEYGFGNEKRVAEITPDDGNVMLSEYDPKALKRRRQAEQKKKIEAQKKAHAIAVARQKEAHKKAQAAKKVAQVKKAMAQKVVAERNKKAAVYIKGLQQSRDAHAGQFQNLQEARKGFKTQTSRVRRAVINKGGDYGDVNLMSSSWGPQSPYSRRMKRRVVRKPQTKMSAAPLKIRVNQTLIHPLAMNHGRADAMGFKIKIKAPKFIKKAVKDVGKIGGKVMNAPLKLSQKILTKTPLVKDVYKGVNKLTGGTLDSLYKTAMLPGKALQTGKVSKADLLEAVVNVVKVGAIVVSGGSAVAVIGATAGALKQGPLGKTSFGRTLLSVGEVAGLAYGAGTGISKALSQKATEMASAKAGTEVGKKLGPIGAIAASAAVSAGAAGANSPGSKIPNAATATGAKAAANAADKAATVAAKQLQESGMKFSTQAAMDEAKKVVIAQAKAKVAQEFKQRTGIPLDIATQVAQGKVPSPAQLKEKMLSDLRQAPDMLKNELSKVSDQMKNADPAMKKLLAEKEKILAKEIDQRMRDIKKVEQMGAKELVDHNLLYKKKAELYVAQVEAMEKVANDAKAIREKADNLHTNYDEKIKLTEQAAQLERKLLAMKDEVEPLGTEVAALSLKSEQIKEDNAARLLIAEHGGKTKFTEGTQVAKASDLSHPMLTYGLI